MQFVTAALKTDLLLRPATILGGQPVSLQVQKLFARNARTIARDQKQSSARFTAGAVIRNIQCARGGLYEGALRESYTFKNATHLSSHLCLLSLERHNVLLPTPLTDYPRSFTFREEERRGLIKRH